MRVIRQPSELMPGARKVCLAIGVFDGVHLGHQQVIRETVGDAKTHSGVSVAVTFDRHPNTVVAPARAPRLIYSLPQKLRAIGSLGVDAIWLIHFDQAFSQITAEQFVRNLARDFGSIHSISVGSNFTFGHRRQGNVDLLKKIGEELKYSVHGLAAVSLDGKVVSSTRIRETIREGNLDAVSQMLGRAYAISGQVIEGDRLGGKIGFPTANLDVSQLMLPPNGVYAALAHILKTGQTFKSALNIGLRPTVQQPVPQLRAEAHLLDFSEDLYGQEIELTLVEKIREEQKFSSLDALREQIARDTDTVRRVLE